MHSNVAQKNIVKITHYSAKIKSECVGQKAVKYQCSVQHKTVLLSQGSSGLFFTQVGPLFAQVLG